MVPAGVGRVVLLMGLCGVLAAMTGGCSAQKPSSKVEGAHTENKAELEKRLALSPPVGRSPVRIDYLRHVSDIHNPEVFVYKERRRLYLVESNVVVRDYPVGLGRQPWGDKELEGDGRTPEGSFVVLSKNDLTGQSAALNLRKTASPRMMRSGLSRLSSLTPTRPIRTAGPGNTHHAPEGQTAWVGQFSIHGGGAHADWTDGSVALYASDMEELSQIVRIGMPVTVRP
jgi:hypothetical protein